jgi:MFS transporter, DHA3 family, macrolide efflux protein
MVTDKRTRPSGMTAFFIVWLSQVISLTGSAMTGFGIILWVWQTTSSATALTIIALCIFGTTVLATPFAGVLVDRWSRKLVLMLSDIGTLAATGAVLILYSFGQLEVWHLYVIGVFQGLFQAFQWPAFSAAISTMLTKERYGQANAMMFLADSIAGIIAPVLAGMLLGLFGLVGIMVIDIATFLLALLVLLLIHIPQPTATPELQAQRGSLLQEARYGFQYILERPGLLGLQLAFLAINLLGPFYNNLQAPMILAKTGNNSQILSMVLSFSAAGGLIGGACMSVWGGGRRRVYSVLGGMVLVSIFGPLLMSLGRSPIMWAVAGFTAMFFLPIVNASNQAIWQTKVEPSVQGRVFAVRRMIAQISTPIALLVVGPLADNVFEPAMRPGGALANMFGPLFGTGGGAGIGLLMAISGVLGIVVGAGGFLFSAIREVETALPDHSAAESMSASPAELESSVPVFQATEPLP